jgi:hypothetical protein
MTAVAITDVSVKRPTSELGDNKMMAKFASRPISATIKFGRDPKAMVDALNQSSEQSTTGFNSQLAVAQLAIAEKADRMVLEDALVSQGNAALSAVLSGLLNDDSMVRSRCAFVIIRMGRSVAGQALVGFSKQYPDSRPLHVAVSLIADQWGGELLAA